MTDIKDGYDIPSDLKHVSRPWYGLRTKHAIVLALTLGGAYAWFKVCVLFGLQGDALRIGIMALALIAICTTWLELDIWMYRFVMWRIAPYYVTRFDKATKQVSGIIGIEGDHYWNIEGDVCAILRLTAMNSDRVDPAKMQVIEDIDKVLLNSMPCPFQIIGITSNYTIDKYISDMLACANNLPKKVMAYRVAHLNFYQQYVKDNNIRERAIYMIIKAESTLSSPIETLDINTEIITRNLNRSGVIGRRLHSDEIADTMIMIATGIGTDGVGYLTQYSEVE